ncbi:caspase family protein [Bradyrhizobium liaoningense]|uniref:caspase family protein n=1 Tax=Bradyrhizobium liaoningense TaxID=43992 RepID=UPI003D9BC254
MHARIFNRVLVLAALIAAMLATTALQASAEKRIALVVGNSTYKNITPLDNPSKDASLMAETLTALGFILVGGRAQQAAQSSSPRAGSSAKA